MIRKTSSLLAAATLLAALLTAFAAPASAQGKKLVIATPGIPPIYSVTIAFLAKKQGFFKKHGADVDIRPFDNGTAAARAVVAGNVDMAWAPTPPVINQISNAGVPLVAVYGMQNPDWVLATTEDGKTCKDLAGQDVGVDFDRRRPLDRAALDAGRRLQGSEAQPGQADRARLQLGTGDDRGPAEICRAASRRSR